MKTLLPPSTPALLLLFRLFLEGSQASDCPEDCTCTMEDSIFCFERRSPTMPQGLPPSTNQIFLFANGIEALSREDFEGLENLELIDLSQNKLTELPDRVFEPLNSLRNLDLSSNQLVEITEESFQGMFRLERLYLFSNHIRTIHPAVFSRLDHLLELKLQGNQLTSLPALAMPHLLLLDLRFNTIPSPGASDLQTPNLESLKLAGMGLSVLDPELMASLGNLHELDISNNHLEEFPQALRETRGLIHLSLAGNPMGPLRLEDFRNLEELEELDVSSMSLQGFPEGFPQLFPHLKRLVVAENPFNCLCSMAWFPSWLRNQGITLGRTEETRCHFPPLNAGKVVERLEHREFGCPTTTTVAPSTVKTTTTPVLPTTTLASTTRAALRPKPSDRPSARAKGSPPPLVPASPSSTGTEEHREPQLCPSHTCLNGGTCQLDRKGHLECTCPRGTWGPYCEKSQDPLPPRQEEDRKPFVSTAIADPPDISSRQVTGTSILLDLHRYIKTRPYIRGIRLTYRNLSGPDRRPLQVSVPASYPEFTLRGLKSNSTYAVCASPLGEPTGTDSACTEARTTAQQHPTTGARAEDKRLTTMLVPALAILLLLALVAGTVGVVCYLRRKRAKGNLDLDCEPSHLELEGAKGGLDNGVLPQKQMELMVPEPAVQNGGVEYEVLLLQDHFTANNNMSSHRPSYF